MSIDLSKILALLLIPAMLNTSVSGSMFQVSSAIQTRNLKLETWNASIDFGSQALAEHGLFEGQSTEPSFRIRRALGVVALREDPNLIESLNALIDRLKILRSSAHYISEGPWEHDILSEMRGAVREAVAREDGWLPDVADWAIESVRSMVFDEKNLSALAILTTHGRVIDPLVGELLFRLQDRLKSLEETVIHRKIFLFQAFRRFVRRRNARSPRRLFRPALPAEIEELKALLLGGVASALIHHIVFLLQRACASDGSSALKDSQRVLDFKSRGVSHAVDLHARYDQTRMGLRLPPPSSLVKEEHRLPPAEFYFRHTASHREFLKKGHAWYLALAGLNWELVADVIEARGKKPAVTFLEELFEGLKRSHERWADPDYAAVWTMRKIEIALRKAEKSGQIFILRTTDDIVRLLRDLTESPPDQREAWIHRTADRFPLSSAQRLALMNLDQVRPYEFHPVFHSLKEAEMARLTEALIAAAPVGTESRVIAGRSYAPERFAVNPPEGPSSPASKPSATARTGGLTKASQSDHDAMMARMDQLTDLQRQQLRVILRLKPRESLPNRENYRLGRLTRAWLDKLQKALQALGEKPLGIILAIPANAAALYGLSRLTPDLGHAFVPPRGMALIDASSLLAASFAFFSMTVIVLATILTRRLWGQWRDVWAAILKGVGRGLRGMVQPLWRLVTAPRILRDTMRYAISVTLGLAAWRWSGNPLMLALPFLLDQLNFAVVRLFSNPTRRLAGIMHQRLAGLAAALASMALGATLLLHHDSRLVIGGAAILNGLLMAHASHVREPPSLQALAPKLADEHFAERDAGARLFGPVLAYSAVLLLTFLNQGRLPGSSQMGILLLAEGFLYGVGSLWATRTAISSGESLGKPESPASLLKHSPELKEQFVLLFVLAAFNPIPWALPYLTGTLMSSEPLHQAGIQTALSLAVWGGSRMNLWFQKRWRLADRSILSWRSAFIPTGLLLLASAKWPTLGVWLPAFLLIGLSFKMGNVTSRAVVEAAPREDLRNTRALYSTAIHCGIAVSPLVFALMAMEGGPREALWGGGLVLFFFQVSLIFSSKLRHLVLHHFDWTLSAITAVLMGGIYRSWEKGIEWFAFAFTAAHVVYEVTREYVNSTLLRMGSSSPRANLAYPEPPRDQPERFARAGHPDSLAPREIKADQRPRVVSRVISDLHLDDPATQADLALDMLQYPEMTPYRQPDGRPTPATIYAGDSIQYDGKTRIRMAREPLSPSRKFIQEMERDVVQGHPALVLVGDHDGKLIRYDANGRPLDRELKIRDRPVQSRTPSEIFATVPVKSEIVLTLPDGRKALIHHGDGGSPLNTNDEENLVLRLERSFEKYDSYMRNERVRLGIPFDFYLVPFGKSFLMNPFLRLALVRQAIIADERDMDVLIFGHLHIPGIWWVPVLKNKKSPLIWIWILSPWLYKKLNRFVSRFEKTRKEIANSGASQDPLSSSMIVILEDGRLELWVWHQITPKESPISANAPTKPEPPESELAAA